MNIVIGHDVFINSIPVNSHLNVSSRRASHMNNAERQQEAAEGSDGSSDQQRNHVLVDTHADLADFQTVKQVLDGGEDGCGWIPQHAVLGKSVGYHRSEHEVC